MAGKYDIIKIILTNPDHSSVSLRDQVVKIVLPDERLEVTAIQLEHGRVGWIETQEMHVGLQLLGTGHKGLEHVGKLEGKPSGSWATLRWGHKELEQNIRDAQAGLK